VEQHEDSLAKPTKKDDVQGAPVLLVSTHVKPDWTPSVAFTADLGFKHVKFLLVPNIDGSTSSLFISFMPGNTHGEADAHVACQIRDWVRDSRLDDVLRQKHSGGKHYQPDVSLRPELADPAPPGGTADSDPNSNNTAYARLVVEVEFCHRNAEKLRIVGAAAFDNPFTSLFLGIKIWKKGARGFAAVAILWAKDPLTQMIALRNAVDFGTREVTPQVRAEFNAAPPAAGVIMLPGVLSADWVRATFPPGYAPPAFGSPPLPPVGSPACLTLPRSHLLHRVTYRGAPPASPYVLDPPPPPGLPLSFDDLHLDLQLYAYELDRGPWP
jgi:hypothetical protein